MQTAASLIGGALRRSGMTARQLARSSGVSEGRISDYVHGRHSPGADQLIRILQAAGLELALVPNFDANGRVVAELLDLATALTLGGSRSWPPEPPPFRTLVCDG